MFRGGEWYSNVLPTPTPGSCSSCGWWELGNLLKIQSGRGGLKCFCLFNLRIVLDKEMLLTFLFLLLGASTLDFSGNSGMNKSALAVRAGQRY